MNENNKPLFDNGEKYEVPEAPAHAEAEPEVSFSSQDAFPTEEPASTEAENSQAVVDALSADVAEDPSSDTEDSLPVYSETSAEEYSSYDNQPVVQENTPAEETFNPYAPKTPAADSFNNYSSVGYNQATSASSPNQVNPSYNQPINQNYNNFNNGYNPNGAPSYNYSPYQPPQPKNNKGGKIALFVIIGICVFVGLIAIISSFFGRENNIPTNDATGPVTETTSGYPGYEVPPTSAASTNGTVISTTQNYDQNINSIWVAEKVRPSVVGVLAYQQGELAGEGSGVLMSEDASKNCTYVITCAHVINEPGCEFVILLLDGSVHEAEIVALDERTDIGVLKVNTTGLPLAEIGDSATLKIGEPIYAIGNPGGSEYFGSITNGIVAAIDRSINATYTMTCIQHNAAINPGNSGGALVNTAGQVIGINSSKIARTDYEGMGFAVPSAIFTSVVDALIQHGYVPNRPELGIKYASVSDYQLYSLIVSIKGLPRESIIIAEIPEGSALSNTQAQVGDLIIAVNGKEMDSSDVLLDLIDTGAVGDTLTLTLCRVQDRSYETSTFDVTVQLVEDKGSITTTTQQATLPSQNNYGDFEDFFDFFGW